MIKRHTNENYFLKIKTIAAYQSAKRNILLYLILVTLMNNFSRVYGSVKGYQKLMFETIPFSD